MGRRLSVLAGFGVALVICVVVSGSAAPNASAAICKTTVSKSVWTFETYFKGWSLFVYPTLCGRAESLVDPKSVFDDAVDLAKPPAGKPKDWDPYPTSMLSQFKCHARLVNFVDPGRSHWDLDTFRESVSWPVMLKDACNPPPLIEDPITVPEPIATLPTLPTPIETPVPVLQPLPAPSSSTPAASGPSSAAPTSTASNPATTYSETTGSLAHTWTDYSDGGGLQGPDISSNQTVQIACWVSGLRVADGNTYWYEIASSPWNSAYFVSGDVFYNDGATSGTLSGTPFVDPGIPSCSNSGAAGSTPTKPTYAETTGSVAHTWSDYSDAGGTQGPEIASNQTVQIACWVSGFRVADGNTYWYEIASSPWNDAYYVSADAFYNNGSTSGSLSETPFVDPGAPNCSNTGTAGSAPTKVTHAETTGSVAHTWTNYSNAGGNEGPEIGSNQTVQIACWVSGFGVADGNKYWYEIASSPWNEAYYVSADAFYNDGATAGSLKGTPFVDPAVPEC